MLYHESNAFKHYNTMPHTKPDNLMSQKH